MAPGAREPTVEAGRASAACVPPWISGYGLIAVTLWGSSFAITRVALETLSPFGLIAVRTWMGFVLLAAVMRARGQALAPLRRDWLIIAFLGTVLSGHLLLQAFGLQRTTAVNTGWIIGFIPITLALASQVLGIQSISAIGWTGVLLGTGGVLVVTSAKLPEFAHARAGDFLQLLSCLTWTIYTLAATGPNARNGVLRVTTAGIFVAAVVTTIGSAGTALRSGPVTATTTLAILFLGLLCNGVAYYMWFAAVHRVGPARGGALLYVEPFVSLASGVLLLGEPVTWNALAGGLAVLLGVWLVAHGTARSRSNGTCQ